MAVIQCWRRSFELKGFSLHCVYNESVPMRVTELKRKIRKKGDRKALSVESYVLSVAAKPEEKRETAKLRMSVLRDHEGRRQIRFEIGRQKKKLTPTTIIIITHWLTKFTRGNLPVTANWIHWEPSRMWNQSFDCKHCKDSKHCEVNHSSCASKLRLVNR